jgi:hypothetical protein
LGRTPTAIPVFADVSVGENTAEWLLRDQSAKPVQSAAAGAARF